MAIPVNDTSAFSSGLFELGNDHIVVTSITSRQDGGFLIRLFNPEPMVQQTNFVWKSLQPELLIKKATGEKLNKSANLVMAAMGVDEIIIK